MVTIKQAAMQYDARSAGRDEYATPKLKLFGSVGALTQSGTANRAENAQMMGAMRMA